MAENDLVFYYRNDSFVDIEKDGEQQQARFVVNAGDIVAGKVAKQPIKTAFGELAVGEFRAQTGWNFSYNLNPQIISETIINGGVISQEGSFAKMETGTDPNGVAFIRTNRALTYTSGRGARALFTAVFSNPIALSQQIQGPINNEDGWAFGYQEEVFGIFKRRSTIDLFIPQSEWNVDKKPDLIPQLGNVYGIDFQWLGFGAQYFSIEDENGDLSLVHVILYANTETNVSVENPSLPLSAGVANFGNTENIVLKTPSAVGGIYSEQNEPAFEALIATERIQIIGPGETYMFSLRNPQDYLGKDNRLYVNPRLFTAATDGNKSVIFRVYSNPTLVGPVWNEIEPGISPLQIDIAGSFIINGEAQVFTLPLSKIDSGIADLRIIDAEVNPRQIFAITAESDSTNEVVVGITFKSRT